jgi:hypothetical protein
LIHLELLEAEAWTLFAGEIEGCGNNARGDGFRAGPSSLLPDVLPRPSSEMLGEMLLLLKSPGEAIDAYKVALKIAPHRLNSLIGARDAAAAHQQAELAAQYDAAIVSICGSKPDHTLLRKD